MAIYVSYMNSIKNVPVIYFPSVKVGGRDTSDGIASRYGLDGTGIESRWGARFPHPSRPALGPTQSPLQWISGLSRR